MRSFVMAPCLFLLFCGGGALAQDTTLANLLAPKPIMSPRQEIIRVQQCPGQQQCRVGVSSWCCPNNKRCDDDVGGCK
jgi:hypothetical protein